MRKRRFVISLLILAFILAAPALVFGQSSTNPQDQPTNVLHAFDAATQQWIGPMKRYANRLFMLLAAIDMAWLGITLVLEGAELQQTLAKVLKKVAVLGFFLAVLENGNTWISAIINSLSQAGSTAAGLAGGAQAGGLYAGGVQPSEILYTGVQISAEIFKAFAFSFSGGLAAIAGFGGVGAGICLIALFCGVCIFLGYGVITITFIMAKIESYVVLGAGYIFLGFGGSRWTANYVERYLGLAIATGTRLMVLYLLIGLGSTLGQQWVAMAQNAGNWQNPAENLLGLVAGVFTFMAVCWSAPKFISGLISGSLSTGAAELIAPAAAIGAGAATVTAAAATGGAALAGIGAAGAAGGAGTLSAGGAAMAGSATAPATEAAAGAVVMPPSIGGGVLSGGGAGAVGSSVSDFGTLSSPAAEGGSVLTDSAASGNALPSVGGSDGEKGSQSSSSEAGNDSISPSVKGVAVPPPEAPNNGDDSRSVSSLPVPDVIRGSGGSSRDVPVPPPASEEAVANEPGIDEGREPSSPGEVLNPTGFAGDESSVAGAPQAPNADSGLPSSVDSTPAVAEQRSTDPAKVPGETPEDKSGKTLHETLHDSANTVRGVRDEAQSLVQHLPQHETGGSAPQLNINHGE